MGLGLWQAGSRLWSSQLSSKDLAEALEIARSFGIDLLDTAELYGWGRSEALLGQALSIVGREGFFVASKVAGFRTSSDEVVKAVAAIDRRLGFSVDLIQLHWPPPFWIDLCRPIRGLEKAVSEGLAHYYGLSNFDVDLIEKALECSKRLEPVSDQVQYSLAFRTPELKLKPFLDSRGLTLIAWSPLAKGALAGARPTSLAQRFDRVFFEASKDWELQKALETVSAKLKASKAQIALAWLVTKKAIPIPGFRNPKRGEEIARAGTLELPEWAIRELDEASQKYLNKWGSAVWSSRMRLVPALLQKVALRVLGGV
ncbi:MAG: aldo/keto reductase [Acidilobaceae archaeon]